MKVDSNMRDSIYFIRLVCVYLRKYMLGDDFVALTLWNLDDRCYLNPFSENIVLHLGLLCYRKIHIT